ncbi:hypothetical protein LCGC14_1893940 [marine sediment metagenome]|uniref:Uncharacterized protein n=1 Tax=marine sediment metagenome TaxID=412755 RepID=A0A0F9FYL9_9ZZZZ
MKLIALTEVKYADESQGSLNWFLKNFFEFERDLDNEPPGNRYRTREGLQVRGRSFDISGVDVWTNRNGEQEWEFLTEPRQAGRHFPLSDITVQQVKTIWPKKS